MLSIDRLGMDTCAVPTRAPEQTINVRIAFTEPAENRKAVKDRLVALTRTAAAAHSSQEGPDGEAGAKGASA